MNKLLPILLLIATIPAASGQILARPNVPDSIAAPSGQQVVLVARASGYQIYTCQAATGGQYAWALKAPAAELYDGKGAIIGHHVAGPSWKLGDGSEVTGKAEAKVNSPDANSIPWLLVTATGHSGDGLLSKVTTIQRINTKGGQPPGAGCNAAQQNVEIQSSYTADYYFYAPEPH